MCHISLCMIVKNEERYIQQCLNSVASIVNEVIIVDTGSTDQTLEIAKEFSPKIYSYSWDNDFAKARNYSLEKATEEWILVLDADEAIFQEDLQTLIHTIQTTTATEVALKFYNYVEENSSDNVNIHMGVRLFKNHMFQYQGAIHEQLVPMEKSSPREIETTNIRIHHYGYLKSNAGKKKSQRNIPILQRILKENPKDSFHLFNMGNEYMSQENYNKALEYFEQADKHKDITLAYCPHLIFRRAACLHYLQRNEEALTILQEGILIYPLCTDYVYLSGRIHKVQKRYSLAIDCFQRCIAMGSSPNNLSFINDVADFKTYLELGHVYYLQDDFPKALSYYLKALQLKNSHYELIYKIGEVLNKQWSNKKKVCQDLESLFADGYYPPNVLVMVDILLNEKLYEEAGDYLKRVCSNQDNTKDIHYLNGRLLFYQKEYVRAYHEFFEVLSSTNQKSLLAETENHSLEYCVVCYLACNLHKTPFPPIEDLEKQILALADEQEQTGLLHFLGKEQSMFPKTAAKSIYRILSKLLKIQEFELFELCLEVLNIIDSNEILLDLAMIYYENGYKDLALKNIIRSIKELGIINASGVYVLNKVFTVPTL